MRRISTLIAVSVMMVSVGGPPMCPAASQSAASFPTSAPPTPPGPISSLPAPHASDEALALSRPAPDALDEALSIAGLTRADLGWRARGYWERYPADIPYKLRHFDDLCAEPLAIVPYVRAMGATVRTTLAPEAVAGTKGERGAGALYRAVHDLGVNKRYGATRAFSANLHAEPTPLDVALLEAWRAEDRQTKFVTFGQESPYPLLARDLAAACEGLPADVSAILGKLVLDLLEARRWALLGFRNVPLEMRVRIPTRLDPGAEETDALEYDPGDITRSARRSSR